MEDWDIGYHARLTFSDIQREGPAPKRPLDFPVPTVHRGIRLNALVVHPSTGERDILSGVIHRASYRRNRSHRATTSTVAENASSSKNNANLRRVADDNRKPNPNSSRTDRSRDRSRDRSSRPVRRSAPPQPGNSSSASASSSTPSHEPIAYFPQRRLQDAIFGSVWACLVLKQHHGPAVNDAARAAGVDPGDPNAPIVWEIAGCHVAIKMVEWRRVQQNRGRLLEDPIKEIAAMQLIGTNHPHVLGSLEVLQDNEYLYSVMPYARGGDLFGYVVNESKGDEGGMEEPVARYWFKQILQGLHFLQSKGICHRDLSLENILVDDDNCLVIDFGMCLRVPYSSQSDPTIISTVNDSHRRRLISRSGTCGKHNYMSPEIFENNDDFDGFAIDLWSTAVILYIMLTGFPPYDHATISDQRFEIIVSGQLVEQLQNWDIHLGEDAGNLLQSMMQLRPQDRLTLAQVMNHPWVTNPHVNPPQPTESPY